MLGRAASPGSDIAAHLPVLCLLATKSLGDIVELGVGEGCSTVALLMGAYARRGRLTSYDVRPECRDYALKSMGLENEDLSLGCWKFSTKNSVEGAADWNNGDIGLLFIDTTHVFDHTLLELRTWLPKMRSDGIICGHDYYLGSYNVGNKGVVCGVANAVSKFMEECSGYRLRILPHNQGLFVLCPI